MVDASRFVAVKSCNWMPGLLCNIDIVIFSAACSVLLSLKFGQNALLCFELNLQSRFSLNPILKP